MLTHLDDIRVQVKIITKNETPDGWSFIVKVNNDGETQHKVTLKTDVWEKLKGNRNDPIDLIIDSFEFLLEHESNQSILRKFNLELIGEYFPEFEEEINK